MSILIPHSPPPQHEPDPTPTDYRLNALLPPFDDAPPSSSSATTPATPTKGSQPETKTLTPANPLLTGRCEKYSRTREYLTQRCSLILSHFNTHVASLLEKRFSPWIQLLNRRNSRWTRDPVVERGTPLTACITDRDVEIFNLLTRYRYLPSDYIHAFIGGNMKALSRRLNFLSRKPNLYLARPHQQRDNAAANYRRLIYELDERGSRVLRERGLSSLPKSYHRNFAHELMVAQIMASVALGTKENKNIRQITWPDILANENTPKATRESPTAASIPVSFSLNGERYSIAVTADACPFGLERTIDGKRTYLFFPGIEADCATEPIETSDFERSSINKKFAAYIAVAEQSIHRTHFGFPNFFVPFITTTPARMHSMMRLLEKITEGRGSKMFLFKAFPSLTSSEKPPCPGGHMLTEPWQRVGFEPFNFTK